MDNEGRGPRGAGFGRGHEGHRGPRRGRGRAQRGDVRAALLALLAEQPMHGYEMIQELDQRTGGAWKPSPGSVYPTLTMLEEEGLVTSAEVEGKRRFTLTPAGTDAVTSREGPAPWEQVVNNDDPSAYQLREVL